MKTISTLKKSPEKEVEDQSPISPVTAEAAQFSLVVKEHLEGSTNVSDGKNKRAEKPRSTSGDRKNQLMAQSR